MLDVALSLDCCSKRSPPGLDANYGRVFHMLGSHEWQIARGYYRGSKGSGGSQLFEGVYGRRFLRRLYAQRLQVL